MKGKHNLTRDTQFQLVYDNGRSWAGREIVIKALPNGLDLTRYGLAVGRRVGKAVVRNRIKRRLREIVRQMPLRTGWDIVFIARAPAAQADYKRLEKSAANLLSKADLSWGEHEDINSRFN